MLAAFVNLLLLAVWLRMLPQRDEQAFFNPYVAGALGMTDRLLRFFHPVLGVLGGYAAASLVLLFLIVFRGVAIAGLGAPWVERVGLWPAVANTRSVPETIAFSFIAFGLLLHRVWMLEWALSVLRPQRRPSRARAALAALAMPLAALPRGARLVALLVFGAALGTALHRVGLPPPSTELGAELAARVPEMAQVPSAPLLAVASLLDVFSVASQLVMMFIILTFVGTLLRSGPAMTIGNEGVELLVGAVFRRPLNLGGFSLAPLVFFVVAGLAHATLLRLAWQVFSGPGG